MRTNIIIAFGCQVRDWFVHADVVKYLDRKAAKTSASVYKYRKGKTEFRIDLVYEKKDFKDALESNSIVIYDGHSRFGQGPVFCPANFEACVDATSSDTNPWGDHFKMGYDAKNIPCIEEIHGHCVNPKEYSAQPPKKFFASKSVNKFLRLANTDRAKEIAKKCLPRGYARRKLITCHPNVAKGKNGLGEQTLKDRHYWYSSRKGKEFNTIVNVGSKDLNSLQLKCSVLFMNSCSSKGHFYEALKRQKKSTKNSRTVFYMTNRTASASTSVIFLRLLLKGLNPRKRADSTKILKKVNGVTGAGRVVMLT